MSRPVVHPAAEQAYRLLPDYLTRDDADTGYTTLRLVDALTVGHRPILDLLTMADPDTSASGSCEIVNAERVPREWLPWLGALLGVDVAAWPVEIAREIVAKSGDARRSGSRNAIKAAVERTLSARVPAPRVWANFSGTDPYLISIVTNTAQTPDSVAALEAALTEKPAGMVIELQVVDGAIVVELEAAFVTVDEMEDALPTVDDVAGWIPTT